MYKMDLSLKSQLYQILPNTSVSQLKRNLTITCSPGDNIRCFDGCSSPIDPFERDSVESMTFSLLLAATELFFSLLSSAEERFSKKKKKKKIFFFFLKKIYLKKGLSKKKKDIFSRFHRVSVYTF